MSATKTIVRGLDTHSRFPPYSITSMARTRMARYRGWFELYFQTQQNSSNSSRKQIFMDFFLFYHGIVCCVYSLESPHRGDSNEYTQHTIIVYKIEKDFPKLSLFASWTGAMINHQWLELPMSRTNFHGPKDVRAIEVRLYFERLTTSVTMFAVLHTKSFLKRILL